MKVFFLRISQSLTLHAQNAIYFMIGIDFNTELQCVVVLFLILEK